MLLFFVGAYYVAWVVFQRKKRKWKMVQLVVVVKRMLWKKVVVVGMLHVDCVV